MRSVTMACLLALALPGGSAQAGAVQPRTGSVRGRVVEAGVSRSGVKGALVIASDSWTGVLDTVHTGNEGGFVFPRLPAGRAELEVRMKGYAGQARRTVPVRAGETVSGVVVTLARSAILTGRVLDAAGRPIAGAEVRALDARSRTGKDGSFRLSGVRPEYLEVTARSDRYRSRVSPRLRLGPGEVRSLPDLVLLPGRTVSGRVVGPRGDPIAGVSIQSRDRSTKTGAHGEFRLGGLEPGGELYAWKSGQSGANVPLPPDSSDVIGLTLTMDALSGKGGDPLILSMVRDTWAPGALIQAELWAREGAFVQLRASTARGASVFRASLSPRNGKGGRIQVQLPALPAGNYTLSAATPSGDTRTLTFHVSDIALIGEVRAGERRLRAVRLADGSGVAGVPIREAGPQAVSLGATGVDGVFVVPTGVGPVLESADPLRPAQLRMDQQTPSAEPARLVALMDRPAVRPGGQVGVKVIARTEDAGSLRAVVDSSVTLRLTTGGADPVDRTGRLDAEGVYVDSLPVPSNLESGQAMVTVVSAGAGTSRGLPLTIRPTPALTVSITSDRSVAMPGESVRFLVQVRRQDGLPATGVRLCLEGSQQSCSYDWGQDRSYGGYTWLGLSRREILISDGSGEATFTEVVPELLAGDADLHYEVRAEEGGSEPVQAGISVHALASSRHVAVLDGEPATPGKPLEARLALLALPRRRVSGGAVHIDLYRLELNRRVRRAQLLESSDLATDASGEIRWRSASAASSGSELRLRATAIDSLGRAAQTEYSWWVAGSRVGAEAEVSFELRALQDTVGETAPEARFQVRAGRPGVLHVALAGRDAFTWLPDVRFVAGATEFSVPASLFGAGGVRVTGYATWNGDVLEGSAQTVVRLAGSRLAVEVRPDRDVASPRDSIAFTVTTLDGAGKPAAAEVDLAVFDRGLLSFGGDGNPDLLEAFWMPRPLQLFITSSVRRGERAGGKDSESLVRRDFRDVALWLPRLRTGSDGTARAFFRAPDNLTSWRITAHAVGVGTAVGHARADVTVRRRVALSLSSPQALVGGDSVVLRATLREAAGEPARRFSDWTVGVLGGEFAGPMPDVTVSPESPAELLLPVRVGADASQLKLTLIARSSGEGDGLERQYPVQPRRRVVFGGPDASGVAWDTVTTLRWNAPALAAAIQAGAATSVGPGEPSGAWRLAARASVRNLERLHYLELRAGNEPGDAAPEAQATPAGAPRGKHVAPLDVPRERELMLETLRGPRALLRADGSLDMDKACEALIASTGGRDTPVDACMREVRSLADRVARGLRKPRISAEDARRARIALLAVRERFGAAAMGAAVAGLGEGPVANSVLPAEFLSVVMEDELWASADRALLAGSCPPEAWLWLLGGRGRGESGVWPSVVASHLRDPDVPVREALAAVSKPENAISWLTQPEILADRSTPDLPGSRRIELKRGWASLLQAPDTSAEGGLEVRFFREVPDTDAWGEPSTRQEPAGLPLRLGETLRARITSTRPLEVEQTEVIAPLCGGLDIRAAVGAEGSELNPGHREDRVMRGRLEATAWRGCAAGSTLWEGTVRVTHAGRFTLLPPALHSRVFPLLYRSGMYRTLDVSP